MWREIYIGSGALAAEQGAEVTTTYFQHDSRYKLAAFTYFLMQTTCLDHIDLRDVKSQRKLSPLT